MVLFPPPAPLQLFTVIGFRLKQPRPHQERRALGRGRRRGCERREGPKERAERAPDPVRLLSRRKIKKRERGEEQTGTFKNNPLFSKP